MLVNFNPVLIAMADVKTTLSWRYDKLFGTVHKGRPHSEGLPSADIFRTRRVLHMRTSTLFDPKKHRVFRSLWCVRTDKGWGSSRLPLSKESKQYDQQFRFNEMFVTKLDGIP